VGVIFSKDVSFRLDAFLSRALYWLLRRPGEERVERRTKRLSPRGHSILDLRWNLRVHDALDDSVVLELAKLLDEHLLRDGRDRALELGEPKRPASEQVEQDDELPPTFEHPYRDLDSGGGGERCMCVVLTHRCVPHLMVRSCEAHA
jgi:hypothetical protein